MPLSQQIEVRRKTTNSRPYSLSVKNPLTASGPKMIDNLTGRVFNYRFSRRLIGGDWLATFNLSGVESTLKTFFLTKLNFQFLHHWAQQKAWEGYIYEMDLTAQGITRRMSMSTVRNKIKAKFTDENGDIQETQWYEDTNSTRNFGTIEQIIWLEDVILETAQATAQTYLKLAAWPEPKVINIRETREISLEVTCAGHVFSLNNKYVTAGDGTQQNVSTYIKDIVDTDVEYVTAGRIDTNTTKVKTSFDRDMRAWDAIVELVEVGDASVPYVVQVQNGRRLTYWDPPPNPTIFWQANAVTSKAGTNYLNTPYKIRPGIMRDQTWGRREAVHTDSYLQSRADAIISEIEISDTSPVPMLKAEDYDDSDYMTALARKGREENLIAPFKTRDSPGGP
jgi:hypothetical protein